MSKKTKIIIPCDEANLVCDKTQYKEATFWEKIKLNVHLLYCKACRKYTSQNTKLTKVINTSDVKCLDKKDKQVLKETLTSAIKEKQH